MHFLYICFHKTWKVSIFQLNSQSGKYNIGARRFNSRHQCTLEYMA